MRPPACRDNPFDPGNGIAPSGRDQKRRPAFPPPLRDAATRTGATRTNTGQRPPGAGRALAGGFGPPAGVGSAWRCGRGDGPGQGAQSAHAGARGSLFPVGQPMRLARSQHPVRRRAAFCPARTAPVAPCLWSAPGSRAPRSGGSGRRQDAAGAALAKPQTGQILRSLTRTYLALPTQRALPACRRRRRAVAWARGVGRGG